GGVGLVGLALVADQPPATGPENVAGHRDLSFFGIEVLPLGTDRFASALAGSDEEPRQVRQVVFLRLLVVVKLLQQLGDLLVGQRPLLGALLLAALDPADPRHGVRRHRPDANAVDADVAEHAADRTGGVRTRLLPRLLTHGINALRLLLQLAGAQLADSRAHPVLEPIPVGVDGAPRALSAFGGFFEFFKPSLS